MHNALVVEAAERHQQEREQQHAPDAAAAPADIDREQGGQRIEADGIPHQARLRRAAHEPDDPPGQQQASGAAPLPQKQAAERPGHEHHARAEDGQRVDEGDEEGHQCSGAQPEQQEGSQQLREGDAHEQRLRAQPAAEALFEVCAETAQPLAQRGGQLGREKGECLRVGGGEQLHADKRRHSEERRAGAALRQPCQRVEEHFGQVRGECAECLCRGLEAQAQQPLGRLWCVRHPGEQALLPASDLRLEPRNERGRLPRKLAEQRERAGAEGGRAPEDRQ